jgi:hypothetical protein
LSTTTSTAISRFDLTGLPWARVDGVDLASSNTAFAAGNWNAALNVTAAGAFIGVDGYLPVRAYVGGHAPNVAAATAADDCGDWSAPGGTAIAVDVLNTGSYQWLPSQCTSVIPARVYCLQQ